MQGQLDLPNGITTGCNEVGGTGRAHDLLVNRDALSAEGLSNRRAKRWLAAVLPRKRRDRFACFGFNHDASSGWHYLAPAPVRRSTRMVTRHQRSLRRTCTATRSTSSARSAVPRRLAW